MAISELLTLTDLHTSISSAEDIPVSLSAMLAGGAGPTIQDIFGPSSRVSFAYFDRATCSWKTSQVTFLLDLERFSETWPDSGTMRNGCAYERVTSARRILESGSSSWPTPRAEERSQYNSRDNYEALSLRARRWPTPRGEDGESCGNHPNSEGDSLTTHWQTPAADSFRSRSGDRVGEMGLDQQARFFPTPAAGDYRTPNDQTRLERNGNLKGEQLRNFVAHSLPDLPTPDGPEFSPSSPSLPQRLNPQFVEWLMGFPIGWTKP